MTQEELIAFINANIRNSSTDAFTALRLNTVLVTLATSGVTDEFNSYSDFKDSVLAGRGTDKDYYRKARMKDTGFIYEYFPGSNAINWTASQTYENLT